MTYERRGEQDPGDHGLGPRSAELAHLADPGADDTPPDPGGDLNKLAFGPNLLGLNEQALLDLGSRIAHEGLTRDQLSAIYNDQMVAGDPILGDFIFNTYAKFDEVTKNQSEEFQLAQLQAFNRGVALAYHLVAECIEGDMPQLGLGSVSAASEYRNRPEPGEPLREALDKFLGSQTALSHAFDLALPGMHEETDSNMARAGGGALILGKVLAMQFGGSGTELLPGI